MRSPRNIPASVRQHLLNRAKSDRRPFNELLQYYAMERFLYRLSQSTHADRFVLKGALMLKVWRLPELRPTMDIDMLGKTSNEDTDIIKEIRSNTTLNKKQSRETFEALLEIMKETLESGEDILFSGFGKFCVKEKRERRGRNPATGGDMMLDARKVVTFKCSGKLKDRVNGKV